MKKILYCSILFLYFNGAQGQDDCTSYNGLFRYITRIITNENLPIDFNKDLFLDHLSNTENISSEDFMMLTENITKVEVFIPSIPGPKTVKIFAQQDVYPILHGLSSGIQEFYCLRTHCMDENGVHLYIIKMNFFIGTSAFGKEDFLNEIMTQENPTSIELEMLNSNILHVEKAFPSSGNPVLLSVITVESTLDFYGIFENYTNAIESSECNNYEIELLNLLSQEKLTQVEIYPNPLTETSILKLNDDSSLFDLEIVNQVGQVVYRQRNISENTLSIKNLKLQNGFYFFKVLKQTDGSYQVLKVLKNHD
jgi:hypothetical protein